MAAPRDLSIAEIRKFMIANGGKVTNHELVKHFKHFLTNPNTKGECSMFIWCCVVGISSCEIDLFWFANALSVKSSCEQKSDVSLVHTHLLSNSLLALVCVYAYLLHFPHAHVFLLLPPKWWSNEFSIEMKCEINTAQFFPILIPPRRRSTQTIQDMRQHFVHDSHRKQWKISNSAQAIYQRVSDRRHRRWSQFAGQSGDVAKSWLTIDHFRIWFGRIWWTIVISIYDTREKAMFAVSWATAL